MEQLPMRGMTRRAAIKLTAGAGAVVVAGVVAFCSALADSPAPARGPAALVGPGKCNSCDCKEFKRKVTNDDKCATCNHFYDNHDF
jgi:hypothetical protein